MTAARQVIPGSTHLVTRRCSRREFLLRADPLVDQIYLYCLGEAAQRYGLTLLGYLLMSNHHHAAVRDNHGKYPEFLNQLHKNIASAMNALHDRLDAFWAAEQPNAVYLVEAQDRFDKLVYLLANPVNGHLVDRVTDWPGASSLSLSLSGRTLTVKRPSFFRADGKMPAEVTLRIERPDGFETLTEDEWRTKLLDGLERAEDKARRTRREKGLSVLGRKAVLATVRTDSPRTPAKRRGIRPSIACKNGPRYGEARRALVEFRGARRAARCRHLTGERDVLFPFGTYRVRGFFQTAPPLTVPDQMIPPCLESPRAPTAGLGDL